MKFCKTDLNFSIVGLDFFRNFCELGVDADECYLVNARDSIIINLNTNDSLFQVDKSTLTSAATVTKDSKKRSSENNLYFTDTFNKAHSDSFNINR